MQRRQLARENSRTTETSDRDAKPGIYDHLERLIVGLGNLLTLVLMLFLANVMLPVGIMGLAIVEIQRVQAGIALFDPSHAGLMAIVALSFYMVLLVVQAHMMLHSASGLEKPIWSLKLWLRSLHYKIGIGQHWRVHTTTPLDRLEGAIAAVGWVIILLGTVGSMATKLGAIEGTWYDALWGMLTQSNLTDFLTYIGGFIFTAALLAATHWGIGYAYERYAKLRPDVVAPVDTTAVEDKAEADYLLSLILPRLEKQIRPTQPVITPATNGHHLNGSGGAPHALVQDGE